MASLPIFKKILDRITKLGKTKEKVKEAFAWFKNKVKELKQPQKKKSLEGPLIGHLYIIEYTAKNYPEKLPYYDRYPLILIIGITSNGFLGLNFHYLPPNLRAQLFQLLSNLESFDFKTKERKLEVTYTILSSLPRYKYFRPCIKRYLASQIGNTFVRLEPNEWEIAMMLPTERFIGASKEEVWEDSRNIIKKYS